MLSSELRTESNENLAGRIIAIGDIHGCSTALRALLERMEPQPDDLILPLGDMIDRGPDSRGVLDLLLGFAGQCSIRPILGNHEEMLLAVIQQGESPRRWLRYGGASTLESYGFSGSLDVVPREHLEFIAGCESYVETTRHFFLHANYDAEIPLNEQPDDLLRWRTLRECMPAPHYSGKVAVVGHTADRSGELLDLGYLLCLDTCCHGGGWLTAMDVVSGQIWQANQSGKLRNSP